MILKLLKKKHEKKFEQDNFVYNILSTLREKINAPTKKKNKWRSLGESNPSFMDENHVS